MRNTQCGIKQRLEFDIGKYITCDDGNHEWYIEFITSGGATSDKFNIDYHHHKWYFPISNSSRCLNTLTFRKWCDQYTVDEIPISITP